MKVSEEFDLFFPLNTASGGCLVFKEEGERSLGSTIAPRLTLSEKYQFETKLNEWALPWTRGLLSKETTTKGLLGVESYRHGVCRAHQRH